MTTDPLGSPPGSGERARLAAEQLPSVGHWPGSVPCDNCDGTGMDSTDHGFEGQPAEVHPCGYCLEGRLPS